MSISLPEPPHVKLVEENETGTLIKPFLYYIGHGPKKNSLNFYYKIQDKYYYGLVKTAHITKENKMRIRLVCRKSKNKPYCGFSFNIESAILTKDNPLYYHADSWTVLERNTDVQHAHLWYIIIKI